MLTTRTSDRKGLPVSIHPDCAEPTLDATLHALGLEHATDAVPITIATDTRVWRVTLNGRPLAVRLLRPDQRMVMDAEVSAMRIARRHGIPAPEVIRTGSVYGRHPVMALEWMPGEPASEVLRRKPRLARRLGEESGRLLARIHRIHVPEGAAIGPSSRCGQTPAGPGAWGRSLLHFDFHPFNVLAIGGRITGVVDWTNAVYGDPRADIARSVSLLRVVAPAILGRRRAARQSIGLYTRGLLSGYETANGPLEHIGPFYAQAGEFLLADLGPKLDHLPVEDPEALRRGISEWTRRFQTR